MSFRVDEKLPGEPGSYALRLVLRAPLCLLVGRLGEFAFPAGDYLYLGSAQGPGGLRARICHHARMKDHPHWHLDWLRPHAVLLGGWYATGLVPLECAWSQGLLRLPEVIVPAPGFGATDCRSGCPAHLIALPAGMSFRVVEEALNQSGLCLSAYTILDASCSNQAG